MTETTANGPARSAVRPRDPGRLLFVGGIGAITVAVGTFLLVRLPGLPPHEDEALPLLVGRGSLGRLFDTVLDQRGGAPLHFLLAWVVAHAGGGLDTMRLLSALFATASIPAIAALANRLAGRGAALAAGALAATSWVLLFHGMFARMYSLFLLLSTLSYLALLHALDRGGRRAWLAWAVTMLLTIGAHPYGALVLASQALYVVLTRSRIRQAAIAFACVVAVAAPLWRSSVVLAHRYGAGIGDGGGPLRTPGEVFAYLWHAAGDFSTRSTGVLVALLLVAALGLVTLVRERPHSAVLAACVVATPTLFFLAGRFGGSTSPQSQHLIFMLPFLALAVSVGVLGVARLAGPWRRWVAAAIVVALLPVEVAWAWHKTPALFRGENPIRVAARQGAAAWLAATSRPDDVLFAYEPLYLAAWERAGSTISQTVVPRADVGLALHALVSAHKPLGRGVWVFDAGDTNNAVERTQIALRVPSPARAFEARAYGPYLIIRTRGPTVTVARYLADAAKVELLGRSMGMGDALVNYPTVRRAQVRWASLSRSSVSS
jgi:hypothetical protein